MKHIAIQGIDVPALGFGTYKLTGAEGAKAVEFAIQTGYTHIDTAQIYENEESVGTGIRESGAGRDKLFVTTKIWRENFQGGRAAKSIDESLARLKMDYVDLLLVHWPFPDVKMETMIEAVVRAQEQGKARLIGVSNFTAAQIADAIKLSDGKICNDQVEYHPFLSQQPILEAARKNGMFITAYSPVARGKAIKDETLKEIGFKYGKNAGQVTLRWLVQQENVAAIPKSATPENIRKNLDIFDFELSDADMKTIHAMAASDGRLINPDFAPEWDKAA